ncbi:Nucleotidyl transferase [Caldithrix abyssi DSM 13497]|uniref:mannose-1-phosphate guanylyltransferase n=1 Tax=Caldithrix abyssi DSM 13497 TaxID=880073 RepID=H1XUX2_CALAY|nr:mannose-1-phosphate guanylyltransferase [Caldithrix abyssi]APF17578.1 mannose-1-phosphate guanylyltransferase [Caldithrix abyssi DSM 13497]EHO41671.1 Nucleotidyl transferase [Caldithrix abyssi DSM 13497]
MHIILMAGGMGTRFWPRSRKNSPKQLLNLVGDKTMIRMTYERVRGLTADKNILIITNQELKEAIHQQIPEIPLNNIIAEPFGKNTAPCIGLAAAIVRKRASMEEPMVILPADHLIKEVDVFQDIIRTGVEYARQNDALITLGITPAYPETGYGYIQRGEAVATLNNRTVYKVKTFAEKPNLEAAQLFLQSGDFLWNSGMFIWKVGTIWKEFVTHQPEMAEGFEEIYQSIDSNRFEETVLDVYMRVKSISIDYAIMEVAQSVYIIEADFKWNDVGSWEAAYAISEKDEQQNAITAQNQVVIDSKNNLIYAPKKLVALIDVENLAVVETEDAILICKKDSSQRVKEVIDDLKQRNLEEYL